MRRRRRNRTAVLATGVGLAVTALAIAQFVALLRFPGTRLGTRTHGVAGVAAALASNAPPAPERTVEAYAGYGTWVDVHDFVPPSGDSAPPPFTAAAVDDMARLGVRTLYLQAARPDAAGGGSLADRTRVAQILVRAHEAGLRVVGWYLPTFVDVDRDLAHLRAIADFEVLGHRFDGVAVDIEVTDAVADAAERSHELVELSERLRAGLGQDALGAIVLPPVLLEVVNPDHWPEFPWRELSQLYDVWLPMGYWTERRPESGYRDSTVYTEENIRRLRDDLGDADAVVHAVGGIGDGITARPATDFARAAIAMDAIGASIYDWDTLDRRLNDALASRINSRPPH